MALNSLYCADVPLSNYSLTHSLTSVTVIQHTTFKFTDITIFACDKLTTRFWVFQLPEEVILGGEHHSINIRKLVQLPLAASDPPLSSRAFIACTNLRNALRVTVNLPSSNIFCDTFRHMVEATRVSSWLLVSFLQFTRTFSLSITSCRCVTTLLAMVSFCCACSAGT